MDNKTIKQSKLSRLTSEALKKNGEGVRPSDFMRARRPALFSDSQIVGEPCLTREIFEYHLDTLTSRKQEIEFEHFCRRLAEREVCPNLLPQTGPTGGGDSKVDTETYPVADKIALRWYEGVGHEASQERWAFAFSAKKAWHSKIRSDVDKLVKANRGYKLVYFITNQFVKDKDRASIEDELSKSHKVTIRVLDRTWIVKCVFEHNRWQLAREMLSITGYDTIVQKIAGPNDVQKERDLKELEQQIDNPERYRGVEYQLAEDCLQTALLARGLERPRVEVEGRFYRAERVAEKVGQRQQRLRIIYNRAWTAFWWYDDFKELNRLYDSVEELATDSVQASDLELLANLWKILITAVRQGGLDRTIAKLDARTITLKTELLRLISDKHRANNALLAQMSLLLVELTEILETGESPDRILGEMKAALLSSEGLPEVPVDSIMEIIQELGTVLADSAEYDELFEVVVKLIKKRRSEGEKGLVLLQRGYQKLLAGKKYDAIRLLGRAQQSLALEEYRSGWREAIAGCGVAYEAAGLLWAARSNLVMAANQALSEFRKYGDFVPAALRYVQKIVWLELQLGRVFCALAWMEIALFLANHLQLEGERKAGFEQERESQDFVLGILLLKTELWELKWLDFLPQILDKLALYNSWAALLYALGHEDYLRSEGMIPESKVPDEVRELFRRWLEQAANEDLPDHPEFLRYDLITMKSFVLGCEVIVKATNTPISISLAETILGATEALLATSLDGELFPYQSELHIDIQPSHYVNGVPQYWIDEDDGGQTVHIRHEASTHVDADKGRENFRTWLKDLLLQITLRVAIAIDPEAFGERLFRDELGIGRALNFSEPDIAIKNIFGESPRFRLSDWKTQAGADQYVLQRRLPWNHGIEPEDDKTYEIDSWQPGEGEPPDDLFGVDSLKHKDRRVLSLINLPLWEMAKWRGAAYVLHSDALPILALGFQNPEPAIRIFQQWHKKISTIDRLEHLRISVITGVDRKHPSRYKIVISTNPKLKKADRGNQFIILARICRMDPPDSQNLNTFIKQYERVGRYLVLPAHLKSETEFPELFWNLAIEKKELRICPAWQIGENDQDVSAIEENDNPIIPNDVKDAPVIRALQRFTRRKKRK